MEFLDQAIAFLSSIEGASLTIAVVLEFVFRLFPSEKPLSVVYVVASVIKKVGSALVKLGEILDKVLPQKIKE